jgi:hypothetical protein
MLTGQRTDKQQILERVKLKAGALQTASDALRNDKEVVLEAVKTSVHGVIFLLSLVCWFYCLTVD